MNLPARCREVFQRRGQRQIPRRWREPPQSADAAAQLPEAQQQRARLSLTKPRKKGEAGGQRVQKAGGVQKAAEHGEEYHKAADVQQRGHRLPHGLRERPGKGRGRGKGRDSLRCIKIRPASQQQPTENGGKDVGEV